MKNFNRVLAVILSLVMLLTAIPFGAFAAGTGASGSAGSTAGSTGGTSQGGLSFTLENRNPDGSGENGDIILTIDPQDVIKALRSDEELLERLITLLKDAISTSKQGVVTVDEILELLPLRDILTNMMKDDQMLSDLIKELGGINEMVKMLTGEAGFLGLIELEKAEDVLINFVLNLEELATYVYVEKAYGEINPNLSVLFPDPDDPNAKVYLKKGDAYNDDFFDRVSQLTYKQVMALVNNDTSKLLNLVHVNDLISDLSTNMPNAFDGVIKMDVLNTVLAANDNEILKIIRNNYKDYLTPAGVTKLEAMVDAAVTNKLPEMNFGVADFKGGVLWNLVNQVLADTDSLENYILRDKLMEKTSIVNSIVDTIKERFEGVAADDVETAIKPYVEASSWTAFKAYLDAKNDPALYVWSEDDFTADFKNEILEELIGNGTINPNAHEDCFDSASFLNAYLDDLKEIIKATPDTYLTPDTIKALESAVMGSISLNAFTGADYKTAELIKLLKNEDPAHQITAAVDLMTLVDQEALMAKEGISSYIQNHLNIDAFTKTDADAPIDINALLDMILRKDETIADLFVSNDVFQEFVKLPEHIAQIKNLIKTDDAKLKELMDLEGLVNSLSDRYGEILDLLDQEKVMKKLLPNWKKLASALKKALSAEELQEIALPIISALTESIDLISLGGYHVITEKPAGTTGAGLMQVNYDEIVKFLVALIPTLTANIENDDGVLLKLNVLAKYVTFKDVDGLRTEVEHQKDVNIIVKFEGDLTQIRRLVAKLKEMIDVSVSNGKIDLDVTMPAALTSAYRLLLNSAHGADLKKELLALADKEGAELIEVWENLSYEQILTVLRKVDIDKLYSYLTNIAQVEVALQKILDRTGLNYSLESLQDLDLIIDRIASGVPSLQAVCDSIEARFQIDVMEILEAVTGFADRNELIQKMLDKLCAAPKVGKYISKLIDNNTLTELLNNYKDADPAEAVLDYLSKRAGKDLQQFVLDHDANELYQAALDKLATYEAQYNRMRSFALRVLDPNYTPVSRWEKLVRKLLPVDLLNKLLKTSLTDGYRGDGTFGVGVDEFTLNYGAITQKLIDLVAEYIPMNGEILEMVKKFLPTTGSFTFGFDVAVTFPGVSEVTYYDIEANRLLTTYLADGVDPSVAITAPVVENNNFKHWALVDDAEKKPVTKIDGDMELRAIYELQPHWVTFKYHKETVSDWSNVITVDHGTTLGDAYTADTLKAWLPTPAELGLADGEYNLIFYKDGEVIDVADILSAPVTADVTYTFEYQLIPVITYTVTIVNGEGQTVATYTVEEGKTLRETLNGESFYTPAAPEEGYELKWYHIVDSENKTLITDINTGILDVAVNADITYGFAYEKLPAATATVTVTDKDGTPVATYTVEVGKKLSEALAGQEFYAPAELAGNHIKWFVGYGAGKTATDLASILDTVIDADITFSFDYVSFFVVTVTDKDGNIKAKYEVEVGQTLADALSAAGLEFYVPAAQDGYAVKWYVGYGEGKTEIDRADILNATFEADATYSYDYLQKLTVTFGYKNDTTENHETYFTVDVLYGETVSLPANNDTRIWTYTALGLHNGVYQLKWLDANIESTPITENKTFLYDYDLTHAIFEVADDVAFYVHHENGAWVVDIADATFTLTIKPANLVEMQAAMEDLIVHANGLTMDLTPTLLGKLLAKAGSNPIQLSAATAADIQLPNGYIVSSGYSFALKVSDGTAFADYGERFETNEMVITVPFAGTAIDPSLDSAGTFVYALSGDKKDRFKITSFDQPTGTVTFAAPHFSDFAIVNEYKITLAGNVNATWDLKDQFVPEGVEITVLPIVPAGYYIKSITFEQLGGSETGTIAKLGQTFTVNYGVKFTIAAEAITYNTYYTVYYKNGDETESREFTKLDGDDGALAWIEQNKASIIVPDYYAWGESIAWTDGSTTNGDIYKVLKFVPIMYTATFEGINTSVEFTVETFGSAFIVPTVPAKTGFTGAWKNLKTTFAEVVQAIQATQANKPTFELSYTAKTYQIYLPDGTVVGSGEYNSSIDLNKDEFKALWTAKAGYMLSSLAWVNLNTGVSTDIKTDKSFTMPDANVRLEITFVPVQIEYYTVESSTGTKSEAMTADFGSLATFTITVPKNSYLAVSPASSAVKLVSFTIAKDGTKTLVFAFEVVEETVTQNATVFTYTLAPKTPTVVSLASGFLTTESEPAAKLEGLVFAGFTSPKSLKFENAEYRIAQYSEPKDERSAVEKLLWLWILIAVVVVIGLIALFYSLYINGKLKTNFMLRFITWLVNIFFNICLGISAIALWIMQGTTKKKYIDFNEFGMSNPLSDEELTAAEEAAKAAALAEAEAEAAAEAETEEAETEEATAQEAPEAEAVEAEAVETEAAEAAEAEATEEIAEATEETEEAPAAEAEANEVETAVAEAKEEAATEAEATETELIIEEASVEETADDEDSKKKNESDASDAQ